MQQKDIRSLAMQIADELCDGGEYFEVGGAVVYGWRVSSGALSRQKTQPNCCLSCATHPARDSETGGVCTLFARVLNERGAILLMRSHAPTRRGRTIKHGNHSEKVVYDMGV